MFDGPNILQCDNDREFKGVLIDLLRKHGIKRVNGRARYPERQGRVEQANMVFKTKLRMWKREYPTESHLGKEAMPTIVLQMNKQSYSSLNGRSLFCMLSTEPRWTHWVGTDDHAIDCIEDESILDADDHHDHEDLSNQEL